MTEPSERAGDRQEPSLADKLNRLFQMVPQHSGRPQTNESVAAAISALDGPAISGSYIWMLRNGKRDNPTKAHLAALADHFGVSPLYFFDGPHSAGIAAELDLTNAVREAGVKDLALSASDLSPDDIAVITSLVRKLAVGSAQDPGVRSFRRKSRPSADPE